MSVGRSGPITAVRFGTDASVSLASAAFNRGSIFVVQIAVARWLDLRSFNIFVSASVVGALVALASDVGLRQASVFSARGDEEVCHSLVARYTHVRRRTALGAAVAGTLMVVAISGPTSHGWSGPAILLIVGSYALQSYSRYLRSPLRSAGAVVAESKLEAAERAIGLAGSLAGIWMGSLVLAATGQAAGAVVGLVLTHRAVGHPHVRATRSSRSLLAYGATLSVAVAATTIYARVDYLILLRMGTQREAATYAACYSLLLAAGLLYIALGEAAMAHLPRHPAARTPYVRFAVLVGVVGGATIAALGAPLVRTLFDLDHPDLPALARLLGLAYLLMSVNSLIGVLGAATGQERLLVLTAASAMVINIGLCVVLVGRVGMLGGAVATVLTEVFIGIFWLVWPRHRLAGGRAAPPSVEFTGGS